MLLDILIYILKHIHDSWYININDLYAHGILLCNYNMLQSILNVFLSQYYVLICLAVHLNHVWNVRLAVISIENDDLNIWFSKVFIFHYMHILSNSTIWVLCCDIVRRWQKFIDNCSWNLLYYKHYLYSSVLINCVCV